MFRTHQNLFHDMVEFLNLYLKMELKSLESSVNKIDWWKSIHFYCILNRIH